MTGTRRTIATTALVGIVVALVGLVAAAVERAIASGADLFVMALGGCAAAAATAGWILIGMLDRHFDDLARLDGLVRGLVGRRDALPPAPESADEELGSLQQAVRLLARDRAAPQADQRLEKVLSAVGEAVVVVTDNGLVSLANTAALGRFGGRLAVGRSLFDVVDRDRWIELTRRLKDHTGAIDAVLRTSDGETLEARLRDFGAHRGTVMAFAGKAEGDGGIEHALHLHDEPPPAAAFDEATALTDLPAIVVDCETTGLDVAADRLISLAAVRCQGVRFFPHHTIDCLVDPGMPIPPSSSRIHGITDAMIKGAPPPAEALHALLDFANGAVIVGHNIGFDLAILREEARRAGLPWRQPVALDTLQLIAALEPRLVDLNLEAIARRMGVDITGRHTALGDALVTADIYTRLTARLIQQGHDTLGKALAFAAGARKVVARQKQAGW